MERVGVLLVGGGVASARCARALRRHGYDGSIVLVGAEHRHPYNRPPLSKELLRDELPDELVLAEPPAWYERRRVELVLGTPATKLDLGERTVTCADGRRIAFERCLLATGAEPLTLPVKGGERALLLRTLSDSRRLRSAALEAGPGAAVTVVGGGFIGVEVASALAALGLRPTVVEMAGELWGGTLGRELAEWGALTLGGAGVELRLGTTVDRLLEGAAGIGAERLEHAFAVAGIGVRPRTDLAERAGLDVDDGVVVDAQQRTSRGGIWAAGDVARLGERRVEHWHAAREAGERAALSMLGQPVPSPRVPWVFSEVGGVGLDVIGDVRDWDEERWVREGSVLAYLRGDQVVQLAIIGSALDPETGRQLVERGASLQALDEVLAG